MIKTGTEATLKMELNNNQLIAQHIRDPLLLVSLDGRIVECSHAAEKLYGYTREELLQLSVHNLRPHDAPEAVNCQIEQAKRQGILFEALHVRKDGSTVPVEVNSQAIAGSELLLSVIRDITERKRAEEALIEARSNLENLVYERTAALTLEITQRKATEQELERIASRLALATKAGGVGIWDYDIVNNTLTWDDQMFAHYGIAKEAFDGTHEAWKTRIHPEDVQQVDEERRKALSGGENFDTEFRVLWPDGTVHHIRALAMVERNASGQPVSMIGTNWDTTERKRAEEALKESEVFGVSVRDSLLEHLVVLDALGVIIAVNRSWRRFAETNGATELAANSLGMNYLAVCEKAAGQESEEDAAAAQEGILSVINGVREELLMEYHCDSPDGQILFQMHVSPLQGSRKGVVITHKNITDRKRAEEVLKAVHEGLEQRVTDRTAELNQANRTLRLLNECDEALLRAKTEPALLEKICLIIAESSETKMTWIGFAEDDAEKTVRPVAQVGCDEEYLTQARVTWADVPRGQGPAGVAIRTRQVDQCLDIPNNPRFALWREAAMQRGYASLIAFPLLHEDQCLGALSIYSSRIEGFNKEEIHLFKQLAENLAFGINTSRSRAERRRLQMELLRISEREKQLIAQELHDGLCQNLAGMAMMSSLQHSQLAAKGLPDAKLAKEICDLLNATVNEARNLAHGLHPVGPKGEGLMNALAQLTSTVLNLFHINCTFVCPEPVSLENETVSTHLFRITQEAINNARKHGQAECVIIGLHHTPEGLMLTIEDNGVGIPVKKPKKSGMGLEIMNHRALEIGATLSVRRAGKNGGTVVTCTRPC